MGYVLCTSACFGCGRYFSFNPRKVPAYNGEPICLACVKRANPERKKRGLDPIVPAKDAYDPIDEWEL